MPTSKITLDQLFEKINTPEAQLENRAYALMGRYLVQIEQAMEEKGWKKKDLAKAVGVAPSYISKIFCADDLVNFRILARMEQALGLDFLQQSKQQDLQAEYSLNAIKQPFDKLTSNESMGVLIDNESSMAA